VTDFQHFSKTITFQILRYVTQQQEFWKSKVMH